MYITNFHVTYSVNGNKINKGELQKIQIKKKDYIDYVESLKKKLVNFDKR